MLNTFNLIATTFRYREFDAIDEILDLLDDLGDADAFFEVTNISGLITGTAEFGSFSGNRKIPRYCTFRRLAI